MPVSVLGVSLPGISQGPVDSIHIRSERLLVSSDADAGADSGAGAGALTE